MLVRYLWGDKCVEMKPSSTAHITNCIKYENFYDTNIEKVKCTECSYSTTQMYKLEDLAAASTAKNIMT